MCDQFQSDPFFQKMADDLQISLVDLDRLLKTGVPPVGFKGKIKVNHNPSSEFIRESMIITPPAYQE